MKRTLLFLGILISIVAPSRAATVVWTNTIGGSWNVATNWSPNFVPGTGDDAWVTNAGSYTVLITNSSASATPGALIIGGSGKVVVDNTATLSPAFCSITNGGTLVASNCWMSGVITVQSGGQMEFAGSGSATIYSLTLTNLGTVTWSSGSLSVGGTTIYNDGLWQITGNNFTSYGGLGPPVWINTGTLRKSAGTGVSSVSTFNFTNQPGGVVDSESGTLSISGGANNLAGGSFTSTSPAVLNILNGTWSDAGGTFGGTGVNSFIAGTFNLRTNVPAGLHFAGGDVYVTGPAFQNAGAITNLAIEGATLRGTNTVSGTLTFTSGGIPGQLVIQPSGQLAVTGAGSKLIYGLTLINQGTVTCSGGLSLGGTVISNGGLWEVAGDFNLTYGGGNIPVWTNSGILRKSTGSGTSRVDGTFVNTSSGLVDAQSGKLQFSLGTDGQLGGVFNASGIIELNSTFSDAGGMATGAGTNRLAGGTLNLRTNIIPGLRLAGGTVNITGTNTFQNAGAITNLTLDGATLAGTNFVSGGVLTMNSGSIGGQLVVRTDGQLVLAAPDSKTLYGLTLINQGSVMLNSAGAYFSGTVISNGGLWQITGDYGLNNGGTFSWFTNAGTFQKTAGSGVAVNSAMNFYNQPGALVQVDSGTLQLPAGSTNWSGTLRLNGGALNANGTFAVAGGTLDGAGTFGANAFTGGTISPGTNGSGQINFSAGLNLNSNVAFVLNGSGPVPGTLHDQLAVTGAVALGNCVLQITALPDVPAGTTFVLINNDGTDPVGGTFNGLPENSVITVAAQAFRIHYAGGTGNDVSLVRDGVVTGPLLSLQGLTNGSSYVGGSGAIPLTTFTVRASTNLLTWTNVGVVTSSVSGAWSFTDTNAWRYSRRFYNTTN